MKFTKMKLGVRLGMGFGVVLFLVVIMAISGYWGVQSLSGIVVKMLKTDAQIAENSARARANVQGLRRFEKDLYLNIGNKEKEEEYLKKWKEQYENLFLRITGLEKAASLDKDRETIKGMKEEAAAYHSGFNKVYTMIQANQVKTPQEANTAISEFKNVIHKMEQMAKDMADEGNKRMIAVEGLVKSTTKQTALILSILAVIAVIVGVGISVFLVKSITRPLNTVISGLSEGADQVASASAQVSSASQSLAEGASEQASGLEETSSSIEEMSSMTRQNAENAGQANTLMMDTGKVVDEANLAMKELTRSMQEITQASEETGKIIKTIDEIAFQTNLLALNAAVEAARAGEAGAGFAVVADEVRNLAMRAAEAAKNTSNLIEGTVKKIKTGSEIVDKTNQAFEKVAAGSHKVAELVSEIAAASGEQAQGIDQINKAVGEMDKVVQQNAANAEESASASEEMNSQAEQMKGFVAELSAVIGGHGNEFQANKALPTNQGTRASVLSIDRQMKSSRSKALPKPSGKGNGKMPAALAHREIKAEQVIPFEEGEFKEF